MEMRKCDKCGTVAPKDSYPKNGGSKDGRRKTCQKCISKREREAFAPFLVKITVPCHACKKPVQIEIEPGTKPPRKVCSYCQEWGQPGWLFSRRTSKEDHRAEN